MSATPARTALDDFVEAFEAAQQRDGRADLAGFLPDPGHPLYAAVLRELVCIDLDYGWSRGRPTALDDYRRRFPALLRDPEARRAVVWEEYRQRRLAGEEPDPEEYRRRYGVNPLDAAPAGDGVRTEVQVVEPIRPAGEEDVPRTEHCAPPANGSSAAPSDLHHRSGERLSDRLDALGVGPRAMPGAADLYRAARRSDPAAAERYARATAAMPEAGDDFLGFHLEAELGHGAFGRVFLARQTDLANRPVALKVATELFSETQALAQLQHTHIMPIYSAHRADPFQAVCMPYLGATTLADVFKALQGKALPKSGKHFVSTLHGRKSSTLPPQASEERGSEEREKSVPPPHSLAAAADALGPLAAHATASLAALERFSYVEAVLWLGARLADGLAHAHERGIVHRDLKPANILLTDDGEPMLLDFNLAEDSKLRRSEAGARIGGTLPYMAPEQLEAFKHPTVLPPDGRSDTYALGLILYELLTGRHPFETSRGSGLALVAQMIAERSGPPPRLRPYNATVSPAVEAIIRRCLEPDPARRYQSAHELQEDIEQHLVDRPLKHTPEPSRRERLAKWSRRHPRLCSATSVGVLAAGLLAAVGTVAWGQFREAETRKARDGLRELSAVADAVTPRLIRSLDAAARTDAVGQAREAVARYGLFDRPDWQEQRAVSYLPPEEQDRLHTRLGGLLFLMTQATLDQARDTDQARPALHFNDLAAVCFRDDRPQAWWEQRAELLEKLGQRDEAAGLAEKAKQVPLRTADDRYLRALRLYEAGQYGDALPLLTPVTDNEDPKHFWAWFLRGNCHYYLTKYNDAATCFSHCISLDPAQAWPYYNRGRAMTRLKDDRQAVTDFRRAVDLDPDWPDARIELGLALARRALQRDVAADPRARAKYLDAAEAELTRVLQRDGAPVRCYFQRAQVRKLKGDAAGAAADRQAGFDRTPDDADDLTWVIRGVNRWDKEPDQALEDFRRAEQINPRSYHALQNQAHVLSEKLNRPEEALRALDRLLAHYPDMPEARGGRAVLLARLGRVEDAVADVKRLLDPENQPGPFAYYQAAGVYALTADRPGHVNEALRLLATALSRGEGYGYIDDDSDLNPIRGRTEFRRLLEAVHTLQGFQKADRGRTDEGGSQR